ncbi:MAG: hypothetical protein IPF99_03615 [Deltaproteobacteria bacterium]|nr:hypothetical protein [Deltaproteobacteria bacterium]
MSAKQTSWAGCTPSTAAGGSSWSEAMASVASLGNVYMAGRQGLFLHCNIDHAVAIALAAAEHLSDGVAVERWVESASRWLDVKVRD